MRSEYAAFIGIYAVSFTVGYLGNDMERSGFTMTAGTFATVGASDGSLTLADLSVSGYTEPTWNEEDEEYVDGCSGEFNIQVLSSSGTTLATYKWYDNGEKAKGWYDRSGNDITDGAASIVLPAGQAVWTQGRGYKLTSAGAVIENDIDFVTNQGGFTAIGNSTPVELTLGKLIVSGYTAPTWNDEDEEYVDGCSGEFNIQVLSSTGATVATYKWYDNGEKAKGWYDRSGNAIAGGASSIKIPAGMGMWVQGRGYTLTIPGVEL